MFSYLWILLFFIIMIYGSEAEPKCYSRFDYDEKMLLKQLRFEDKVSKFEDEIEGMKDILKSEQSKRADLFENEMNDYRDINAKENLRQLNVTKMLRESVKQVEYTINDTVHNFTEVLNNELKEMAATLDSEKIQFNESFNNAMNEFLQKAIEQKESHSRLIQKVNLVVEKAEADLKASLAHQETLVTAVLENVDKAIKIYKKYSREDVVFTVTTPYGYSGSSSLKFQNTVTNEGNGYKTATGIFTSPVPGLYYFSLHLVKKMGMSADEIGCYIQVNLKNIARAFFEPYDYSDYDGTEAERGSYGISTSMFVKLEADDEVSVGDCTSMSYYGASETYEPWSSFNGHLIRTYY